MPQNISNLPVLENLLMAYKLFTSFLNNLSCPSIMSNEFIILDNEAFLSERYRAAPPTEYKAVKTHFFPSQNFINSLNVPIPVSWGDDTQQV